jgi:hypothetical protein
VANQQLIYRVDVKLLLMLKMFILPSWVTKECFQLAIFVEQQK